MFKQMIGRKQAVAIGKEKVRSAARSHAIVSAQRNAEALVRMRDPLQRIAAHAGKFADNAVRAVLRAVVGDDNLEPAGDALLQLQRNQRPFKVLWSFVSREDD